MALEKRNPIPPGRYWLDLASPEPANTFLFWAKPKSEVQIETTEQSKSKGRTFIIFNVAKPTYRWGGSTNIGYPTVAAPEVTRQSDTVQRPSPEPPFDPKNLFGGLSVGAIGALLALWLFSQRK